MASLTDLPWLYNPAYMWQRRSYLVAK